MIDLAINHKEEINRLWRNCWFEEKYQFFNASNWYEDIVIDENSWNKHQFVSLDKNGNVLGFIDYKIDRNTNNVRGLRIINFSDNKLIFGLDCGRIIYDIFEKFGYAKLTFSVIVGNPIEKTYDKFIKRYGGRIVGTFKNEVVCVNSTTYHDMKYYEILKSEFDKNK